ncbi:2OG-Fe(II) oxygenase family protein [Nocardia asteroides]|uniref:2OG-Fe(II) oxygenase family protein n=1 Tax=Nocardia asteroides TaxID=1824 RepID=UPI001E2DD4D3|nr:2OG-Fe(II) oxygenase family protein [Nocardia asteroides]UGT61413.1 hypothetical protein LTT61_30540 [Nocardia asteroides]
MTHTRTTEVVDQILRSGYATISLVSNEAQLTQQVIEKASEFFRLPINQKLGARASDNNHGYRTIGLEYSQVSTRPDLNESFSIWGFHKPEALAPNAATLARSLQSWHLELAPLVEEVLLALRHKLFPTGQSDSISSIESSYAQINHYGPIDAQIDRPFLQDTHEDGHLITLLTTEQAGLEVSRSDEGPFQPITPGLDFLLIMPGSALTAVSGGAISPLYHRVRNLKLRSRYSLMYFANPSLLRPVYGWSQIDEAGVDLGPAIAAKPNQFGLPEVPRA